MNIRKISGCLVLLNCFVFTIIAQNKKQNICSEIKAVSSNVFENKILVTGEVFSPRFVKSEKFPVTLSQLIAMVGGFNKKATTEKIQIVNCSPDFSSIENVTFVNFQNIKNGKEKDLEIKSREIIYVPERKDSSVDFILINSNLISELK